MMRVAQVGTFDVDNLGDLLFPLVFRHLLADLSQRRGRPIELTCFSPRGCIAGELYSDQMAALPLSQLDALDGDAPFDAIFVGGGDIIRGDNQILAAIYGPAGPPMPYSTVVSPTQGARRRLVLLMPGVPFAPEPAFAIHLENSLRRLCSAALRDPLSARRLTDLVPADLHLQVLPDLVNAIADVFPPGLLPAPADALPPDGYLCFQTHLPLCADVEATGRALRDLEHRTGLPVMLVEIGVCLGDADFLGELAARFGFAYACRARPGKRGAMLDKVALIARSRGFIGGSLHGAIIANAYGVPHFCFSAGGMSKITGFYETRAESGAAGRCFPDFDACAAALDVVAADIAAAGTSIAGYGVPSAPYTRIKQFVDAALDAADSSNVDMAPAGTQFSPGIERRYRDLEARQLQLAAQIADMTLTQARRDTEIAGMVQALAQREQEIAALRNSTTWRLAAPLRALTGRLRH
jgi:hypothetical protein